MKKDSDKYQNLTEKVSIGYVTVKFAHVLENRSEDKEAEGTFLSPHGPPSSFFYPNNI